jgi:hypothetical protein
MYASSIARGASELVLSGHTIRDSSSLNLSLLVFLSESSWAGNGADYVYAMVDILAHSLEGSFRPKEGVRPKENRSGCKVLSRAMQIMMEENRRHERRLEDIAQRAQHKPLSESREDSRLRRDCCGLDCIHSSCGSEHVQCNALDVCRRMARFLYKDKALLT